MVLTSILRRKSVSDSTSQSTDTLDQLTSFLRDLENESLSACAECTRRRLLDLLSNKRQLKLTVKRLSLQSSRLGSTASSLRSDSPISPDIPDIISQLGCESQRSVSTSPMVSPILSPIVSPTLHRVSFQGSSSDGYEIDVDFMLDSADEPETFIKAPIPRRFRKKNKQKMSDISERDQLMDEARKILNIDQQMGVDEESEPLYGFLMRKTRLSWIQRWCVCSDNSLYISKSPRDHLSVTKVYLPHYSICRCKFDEHKRDWVFKIWGEGKKTIFLAAQNQQSRDHWVQGLREAARSTERTPVNTLTKSTIKQMATSSLSTLKGITLGRERTSSKSVTVPKSPSDTDLNKASLTSAFEREFPSHGGSGSFASDDVWLEAEPQKLPSETVVLSGTLKKSNRRSGDQWDFRHYVVIGSILREYVSGTDEWPQDSIYLPGSKITTTCNSSANPPYVIKIEPIGKAPMTLAAKSRLELNVWEQELKAISKLRPDPVLLRDMDPDYVDINDINGPPMSYEQTQRGATVSFGARTYTEKPDEKSRSSSMQSGSRNRVHQTPTPKRGGGKFQRGHRRTHSDNYFNPAELRTPAVPQPRNSGYTEVEAARTRYASSGSRDRYHHVTQYRDVQPMLPPPSRPVPTLPPEPSPALPPHSPNEPSRPRSRGSLPSKPSNVTMPSRPPPPKPPKYKPINPPQDSTWPYPVPNPYSDQESQYCSPPNDTVFHSAESNTPFYRPVRACTPDKRRNRNTTVYSDSGDNFDPGEPYNRFTPRSQRLGSSGNTVSSSSYSRYESSGSSRFDSYGTNLSTPSSRFKSSEGGSITGSQRLEGSGSSISPLGLRFRNPLSDVDPSEPVSPFNRRANTPPGTRFNRSFEREDLDSGQPFIHAAAQRDPTKATRSRHCSADDKPTEGHLEVKETHHWVTRWVSVRGNVVRIKATQEDNNVITSVRLAGWVIASSDEDNKWAILLSKPGSNDEKMMFAAHTRESRDKWIFSLNKCCSSDSLESFRSNSMNGSTITLNTVDKIRDVKEEISSAEFKGYLREKTHMFQWTRRYCFVTKHSLYITLSEENLEPLFEIVLSTISVNPDSELKKPYAFRLVSTQIARELFLAAESQEEYDTWLLALSGKPVPKNMIPQNKAPRSEPAPAPIPACKMKDIAHTKGLLFRLVDGNWICSWCARHHSNLLLYDSENSALPFNSVKLSGADIATDLAHNIYRFLITPVNQDNTLTLGTESITDFERWCASFTMATTIRSRTATGSSSTRGDSFGRKYESSDYCTTSSAERLDNSNQSLPAERFTSGYGSADSLNSAGTGVYENVGKHHSNRNSSEYEDYVNMGHVPPAVPQRQANEMVEEWVDKVQQVEPEYDEADSGQPPDLPDKPRDHVLSSRSDNASKLTTREMAANMEEDDDEDYAELPPMLEHRRHSRPQPVQPPVPAPEIEEKKSNLPPVRAKFSNESTESSGFDTSNISPPEENLDLISDKEFERLEREVLENAASSEDPSSKVSSSNDLLINQPVDFPFDDLLDQLEELDEPKNVSRLLGDLSDLPTEIPTPVSEPESHPSHSSYDIVSQDVSPDEPLQHISEKEIQDAAENVSSEDKKSRPTSTSPSSASSSSTESSSSQRDDSDKVPEKLKDTPKPAHSNVSRLSSLDKLETWDSGMEESLLRTNKILKEATEEHEQRMFPDQLLLKLGSLEDDSLGYNDLSSTDLPSPPTSSIESCESPQSDNPPAAPAPKPKIAKPVSKLARPSGLAPPSKLATPSPRSSRSPSTGTLKKCTASRSSDNVSGLPKSRPTSTEGRSSKIQSPYGTLPRNRNKNKPKQTKLTRSRQNSSEGGIPGPRASPSNTSVSSPSSGLRKATSRDSSSGLVAPKKTSTLPRPSRSLARPTSGSGLQKPAGLKVPAGRETVRSRSSSRESVASSGDREVLRRDSTDSATTRSSLSRNNPTERSMRRRLLSNETSKSGLNGKRRLSAGTKKVNPEVLRSPSYQNAVSGSEEPSVPKRSTSLRPSGTSSLPGSNSSSPTPRAPVKSRGSTLPTPSSVRSPSRSSTQSPGSSVSKLRTVSTSSRSSENRLSRGTEEKTETPKSILKQPKSESKVPKSGLPAPKSGLKAPSSSGLRKPSAGGIPRPSR